MRCFFFPFGEGGISSHTQIPLSQLSMGGGEGGALVSLQNVGAVGWWVQYPVMDRMGEKELW